jgi:hypothetical protein
LGEEDVETRATACARSQSRSTGHVEGLCAYVIEEDEVTGSRCSRISAMRRGATATADDVSGRKLLPLDRGGEMYARVATFESDPSRVEDAINIVRAQVESDDTPPGLEGAKMLMLVNRETGKGVGITLFENEEAMRRGDEALDAMNPGASERRVSVEFFEVPVQTVSS